MADSIARGSWNEVFIGGAQVIQIFIYLELKNVSSCVCEFSPSPVLSVQISPLGAWRLSNQ